MRLRSIANLENDDRAELSGCFKFLKIKKCDSDFFFNGEGERLSRDSFINH